MSHDHSAVYPTDKQELYQLLQKQLSSLMEGIRDPLPNMANMSALLYHALSGINWAGFYVSRGDHLLLGPFQGKTACVKIPLGKGVCGTAAQQQKTLLVADVHAFPGHIACDSASNSEMVVPLVKNGTLLGVLDIDSPHPARFDNDDKQGLETLASLLLSGCDF